MDFYGDYHIHSVFSHGKSTIEENAYAASNMGFKQIAITDHGFAYFAFGLTDKKVTEMQKEMEFLRKEHFIDILFGIESNLIGRKGIIDIKDDCYSIFDIVLCNFHLFSAAAGMIDFLFFYLPNLMLTPIFKRIPKCIKRMNTKALIRAIINKKIDVVTHINNAFLVDTYEVAKACADYGTYIELSGKKINFTDEQFYDMAKTGVKFILNSDAHKTSNIGNFNKALSLIERINYPIEKIVNYKKAPQFRSKNFANTIKA